MPVWSRAKCTARVTESQGSISHAPLAAASARISSTLATPEPMPGIGMLAIPALSIPAMPGISGFCWVVAQGSVASTSAQQSEMT